MPGWRQAIIWTNAGIVLIGTLGTSFIDILSRIHTFSFKKMYLEMSSAKWRPFCVGLNVLEMPHDIADLCHHWFRWYLGACLLPSHYLNQCWLIVKWTNILQWNFFYKKIHLQIVCKMLTICSGCDVLTHLPLDKMATILADNNFKCIFLNENDRIPIRISLEFVPRSPIDNKPALVQVMAWHLTGNKPLSEPVVTQFTDAYMRH